MNALVPLRKRVRKNSHRIYSKHETPTMALFTAIVSFIAGGHSFDVIMFDVDNKDSALGMSGPPPAFVETLFLQKVYNLLSPRGTTYLTLIVHDV